MALFLYAAGSHSSEKGPPTIHMFELHSEEIPGSVEISGETINVRGFIKAQPDLEIHTLERVTRSTQKTYSGFPPSEDSATDTPALTIQLTPKDAKSFGELTARIRRKRIVIKIGGVIQSAPRVMEAILNGEFVISCPNKEDQAVLAAKLEDLVK